MPRLKVVQLQGEGKESRIQLRTPGGRVLGSHGEAAAFMEEEGNYGEEDIQNLYKVTVPQPVESKVKGGTSNPGGSILAAPRRPGQNLSGELGLHILLFFSYWYSLQVEGGEEEVVTRITGRQLQLAMLPKSTGGGRI